MNPWVLRAVALGGFIVLIRFLLEQAMEEWPTHSTPMRGVLFLVLLAVALGWGYADGRKDRTDYPNPDDGEDLTMLWIKVGVVAGLASGLVSWLIGLIPGIEMGGNSLFFELTSAAAFFVLVLFLPAALGIAIARRVVDRRMDKAAKAAKTPPAVGASR